MAALNIQIGAANESKFAVFRSLAGCAAVAERAGLVFKQERTAREDRPSCAETTRPQG